MVTKPFASDDTLVLKASETSWSASVDDSDARKYCVFVPGVFKPARSASCVRFP